MYQVNFLVQLTRVHRSARRSEQAVVTKWSQVLALDFDLAQCSTTIPTAGRLLPNFASSRSRVFQKNMRYTWIRTQNFHQQRRQFTGYTSGPALLSKTEQTG